MCDKIEHVCKLQRVRIVSSIGDGATDIFVDFNPIPANSPAGSDMYVTLVAASQNQNGGVAQNVGLFVCTPDMNPGGGAIFQAGSSGGLREDKVGTFIQSDGSNGFNWGNIYPGFSALGDFPIPPGWFFRFATYLNGAGGFPGVGAQFQIDVCFFVKKLSR